MDLVLVALNAIGVGVSLSLSLFYLRRMIPRDRRQWVEISDDKGELDKALFSPHSEIRFTARVHIVERQVKVLSEQFRRERCGE